MRLILSLFLCMTLFSCDYFEKKKVSSEEILEDSLKTFNWNEVDEYPFFKSCDSTASISEKKLCFERTISDSIGTHLGRTRLVVDDYIQDTVQISISIAQTGNVAIDSLEISGELTQRIPELDSIIRSAFNNLPEAYPAIKRGQPVNSVFKMPVIVEAN